MKLGEKIRKARLALGMTQSELAGDFITRNMLSQIENGLAMPSLQTALYIADKLGLDAGILFSEGDNKSVYFVSRKLPELKTMFAKGEYDKCIETCLENSEECDEANYILAECYMKKAYDAYNKGKLRHALKFGENALKYGSKTFYSSDCIKQKNDALEVMISILTPYLKQTKHKNEVKKYLVDYFVENSEKKSLYFTQNEARLLMVSGKYSDALNILKELLKEKEYSVPFEYTLYCDLEECYREIKDYENAYTYSQMSKRLFEEMQQ